MRDHQPIVIEEFNGLWARGDADPCPVDHFTECINQKFIESGYQTRDGLNVASATATSVLRIYPYFDASVGDGFLVLRSDTKIYHVFGAIGAFTIFQVSNAIATMTDFGFISVNGRAYISPSTNDNLSGLSGEFVYVYDGGGINMMRQAAGTAPTTAEGALAVANGAAGKIEAGIHIFGVVYETNSGFLTKIGPDTLNAFTAAGVKKADLTAIPIFGGGGGTLITKRHIVASKLIIAADYTGDAKSYQLFFVPGGEIANNTATTLTVDFYDSELTEDASHLLDILATIPAGGGLGSYHNRMLVWDTATNINEVLVSSADEPEAFNSVDGLLIVPKEGTGITICQEYRDVLYVMKFNKMMAFNDNGDVPSSWSSGVVDQGLGAGKHGVSTVGIYGGTDMESFICVNDQGIHIFSGTFAAPELSYKIKDFWLALTRVSIRTGKISAYTNPVDQLIFINIPESSMVLVGDYTNGLNAEKIKWTKWTFGAAPATMLLFDKDNKLFLGMPTGVHYIQLGATSDTISGSAAVKIPDPTVITALLPEKDGIIYHYGSAKFRVVGTGNLIPKLYSLDGISTQTLASIILATSPGREPVVLSNMLSQRARLELKTSVINETFKVNRVIIYVKPIYSAYPM